MNEREAGRETDESRGQPMSEDRGKPVIAARVPSDPALVSITAVFHHEGRTGRIDFDVSRELLADPLGAKVIGGMVHEEILRMEAHDG